MEARERLGGPIMGIARGTKLRTVEMARGIAATMVVLFHANAAADEFGGPAPGWLSFGEHGVDFFFVLSGFIIFAAHGDEIGRAGVGRSYLLKRGIRLLPLLWFVVLGWAALRAMMGLMPPLDVIVRSVTLIPSLERTLPNVVWTLRHEALFYLVFLVLLMRPAWGKALFALWFLAAAVQLVLTLSGRPVTGLPSFFLSSFTLDFLAGMLVAVVHRRRAFSPTALPLVLALVALCFAFVVQQHFGIKRTGLADYVSVAAEYWTLLLGLLFAFLLHGLLRVEKRWHVPEWLVVLGGASYAIYLVHTLANSLLQRIAIRLPSTLIAWGMGHTLLLLGGLIAGIIVHFLFEKPVTKALRARLLPRSTSQQR